MVVRLEPQLGQSHERGFLIFQAIGRGFFLSSPKCLKITSFTVLKTSAFSKSISLLRSASLRASLRRKEVTVSL
jgi:hypothetical protein